MNFRYFANEALEEARKYYKEAEDYLNKEPELREWCLVMALQCYLDEKYRDIITIGEFRPTIEELINGAEEIKAYILGSCACKS